MHGVPVASPLLGPVLASRFAAAYATGPARRRACLARVEPQRLLDELERQRDVAESPALDRVEEFHDRLAHPRPVLAESGHAREHDLIVRDRTPGLLPPCVRPEAQEAAHQLVAEDPGQRVQLVCVDRHPRKVVLIEGEARRRPAFGHPCHQRTSSARLRTG